MYESLGQTSNSTFVQKSNRVILKLLEITGVRVGEIALLTVENIQNVFNQENPSLKMRTLKRRGGLVEYSYDPANKADFNEIITYIKIYRSKVIKNTIGKGKKEGFY